MKANHKKILYFLLCNFALGAFAKQQLVNPNKFILLTTLYNETHVERLKEYMICMQKNLEHELIEEIVVFYDVEKDDKKNKLLKYLKKNPIKIHYIDGRPTFQDFFDYANNKYPDSKIIVSNADIYFNHTLFWLEWYDLTNQFIALTRWDADHQGNIKSLLEYTEHQKQESFYSQDVWIFKTPLRKFENANIKIGTYACDCYLAQQAYASGLKVLNPCLSIQCCHLHESRVRRWRFIADPNLTALSIPWCTLTHRIFYLKPGA